MTKQDKTSDPAKAPGMSESERMAKVRELLVGPAIADESKRVEQSFDRLNDLVKEQQDLITTLTARIRELEDSQRNELKRVRVRLLGMVESLIANEDDVRSRLMQHDMLMSELDSDQERTS